MRPSLTPDEAETLKYVLDYTVSRLDDQINGSNNQTQGFAIRFTKTKVSHLRDKIFPAKG